MTDIAKLIERLWAINCGSQGCQSTREEAVDALKRLTRVAMPEEVQEEAGYLRMLANATVPDLPHVTLPGELREIADLLESQARENARLAAELAVLSEAAMDADLHCWGPGFVSPEHAAPYAKALRLLCQPNADRSNAAWKLLDDLRRLAAENAELTSGLRYASLREERDRLRAELETAKRGLTQLSQLGGGRSEGNLIAQETLARLDAATKGTK